MELDLIKGCDDIEKLTDGKLRTYLDSKAEETTTVVTADDFNQLVQNNVHMDVTIKSAKGRMKLLFMSYKSLLRQHYMKWVAENTPNWQLAKSCRSPSLSSSRRDLSRT